MFLFLKQGLFQSLAASKIIYGAKRNVIADSDTFTRGQGTYLASIPALVLCTEHQCSTAG
jgi:hypothetical protein